MKLVKTGPGFFVLLSFLFSFYCLFVFSSFNDSAYVRESAKKY